jgi:sugar lactone lactonase YvrE
LIDTYKNIEITPLSGTGTVAGVSHSVISKSSKVVNVSLNINSIMAANTRFKIRFRYLVDTNGSEAGGAGDNVQFIALDQGTVSSIAINPLPFRTSDTAVFKINTNYVLTFNVIGYALATLRIFTFVTMNELSNNKTNKKKKFIMRTATKIFIVTIWTGLVMCNSSYAQIITTVTGTGTAGFSGDGGAATLAQVNLPTSVCRDIYGNLYIADRFNHRVRKIDATSGNISTIAGTGTAGFSGDGGLATTAQLNQPIGVVVANDGTIYISDKNNNRIRKINLSGIISTYAGTGIAGFSGDGGLATLARLNNPWGITLDINNNLYIADRSNDRVRKIDYNSGIITTVAGTGTAGYSGDNGLATLANFNKPISVCVDTALNIYVADENNHRVRKVTYSSGIVNKIAGTGTAAYNGDGILAVNAQLNYPCGVAVDLAGYVYISDRVNHRLRKIDLSGNISTIAGTGAVGFSGDGGNATSAQLNYPRELFSDGSGNIYFADTDNNRIRKITYCNLPTIPTINASQNNFCTGGNTTLTIASGNLNNALDWQWYDASCGVNNVGAGTSLSVSPSVTTTYYVRGEGGCVTPSGCGSITITVLQIPSQPGTISGNATVCSGSSQTYSIGSVSGATSYSWTLPSGWSGTSTTNSISATAGTSGGTISVTADNSCGSSTAQTLAVSISMVDTSITVNGITLTSNATPALYQWVTCPAFSIISGETNQSYTPSSNGNYAVIVTQNGCIDTSDCYLVMTVGFSNIDNSSYIIIYPNPATQNAVIKFDNNNQSYSLTILNSHGQLIQTVSEIKTGSILIETQNLAAGVYYFQLQTTDKIMTGKLIVGE